VTAKRIVLRTWRVVKAEPSGLFVWYDPAREAVELYEQEPLKDEGVLEFSEGDDSKDQYDLNSNNEIEDLPF